MKNKYTSTIAGATVLLAGIGIISRGLGFFREITFAGYYGLSSEFDLYLIGTVIPVTLNTIVLFIAQNVFIPSYNKYKNEGLIDHYFYHQVRLFLFISFLICVAFYVFSNALISIYQPNIDENSLSIVKSIFSISLISIPFSSLNSIYTVYLQVNYNFKSPAISQLFLNIIIIFIVILFSGTLSIFAIPIGYVLGNILQTIYLIKKTKMGLISIFKFNYNLNPTKTIKIKALVIIAAIESIGQLYIVIDRFFYSQVDKGGIAAINYAQNIFLLPMQIFSLALTTVMFPKLSEYYSNKLNNQFNYVLNNSINAIALVFIPITFVLLIWGDIIIKILYEHGKFVSDNSLLTYQVLQMLTISLFFYSIYAVLNKVFYTVDLKGVLLIITIVGIFIKIFLNSILVKLFSQKGLALSTSITYIFFFAASLLVLKNKNIFIPNPKLVIVIISNILNTIISYITIKFIFTSFVSNSNTISILMLSGFMGLFILNLFLFDKETFFKVNVFSGLIK